LCTEVLGSNTIRHHLNTDQGELDQGEVLSMVDTTTTAPCSVALPACIDGAGATSTTTAP
jgi:hypothetical protein